MAQIASQNPNPNLRVIAPWRRCRRSHDPIPPSVSSSRQDEPHPHLAPQHCGTSQGTHARSAQSHARSRRGLTLAFAFRLNRSMEHRRVAFKATRLRFRVDQDKIHSREPSEESRALPLGDQDRRPSHLGPLRRRWWTLGARANHEHHADAGPRPASGFFVLAGFDERHPGLGHLGHLALLTSTPSTKKVLAILPLVHDRNGNGSSAVHRPVVWAGHPHWRPGAVRNG